MTKQVRFRKGSYWDSKAPTVTEWAEIWVYEFLLRWLQRLQTFNNHETTLLNILKHKKQQGNVNDYEYGASYGHLPVISTNKSPHL